MSTNTFTDINEKELDGLIERVQEAISHDLSLSVADMQWLLNALMTLTHLHERMADNDITLHKLRKLAGIVNASEKLKNIAPTSLKGQRKKKTSQRTNKNQSNGDDITAPVEHQCCHHKLEAYQKGQVCPECERGKLYKYEPATHFRISGQSPLMCTKHIIERLRCNACGTYFTAPTTEEARQDGSVQQTYGYSARALMAIYKYYAGNPFYRQQTLQHLFAMPVSASTVFDQCEHLTNAVQPVMQHLITLSAHATHYHLDDTTNRILNQRTISKPDRKTGKPKARSGIYTSGMIATLKEGPQVVLFQTNIGHAGEWIDEILTQRPSGAPPPMVMCDALSRNFPTQIEDYHLTLCNAHARREFVDVFHHFPDKVNWILERYGGIWENDDYCKTHNLSPQTRCAHHAEHSLPIMEAIRLWAEQQLETEQVEENSGLGKAMTYYLRHFKALTGFCRIPGAQLDNNEMEATLKLIIRGRKNSLFFKTLAGASVADVLTSLIATGVKADINVFEYFVILQRHADEVKKSPQLYLPWNYQLTFKKGNVNVS